MTIEILSHRSQDGSPLNVRWCDNSTLTGDYETAAGVVSVKHGRLVGGKSEGVEVVFVDTGKVRALLLPGRGMGVWKMWSEEVEFGWGSPVDGPVHPALVPVMDPGGLGWLEGFDELVVRCGLESNGAPEWDAQGHLRYPLHGRIANLPVGDLRVELNEEQGCVELIGDVVESKLFFHRFRLRCRVGFVAGSSEVRLVDEVTNELSVTKSMQMLYHINVGSPILAPHATIESAFELLAPKDALSASEIDQWDEMGEPQAGYGERVYFAKPIADEYGWTTVMLRDADGRTGLGLRYDTSTLPYFILWKNTAASADGYVVGLEPATNLPNARSFEAAHGRVVSLGPGESTRFEIRLLPFVRTDEAKQFAASIESLSRGREKVVCREPRAGWSVDATAQTLNDDIG